MVSPKERGLATAMFDAASRLASAIGVPLIGILLLKAGWRWSFAATGLVSLLYFVLFSKVYRDPKEDAGLTDVEREYITSTHDAAAAEAGEARHVSFRQVIRQRKVFGLALGFGSYNYVYYLLLTWLPTYLSTTLHVDLLHSFLYTGVPWIFATCTDLGGGWLVDALIRRGWNASRVRRTILIAGTAFGLGILGAAHAQTPIRALVWISISIGGLSAAAPVGWSIPSIISPPESVGTVAGIVSFSNQLSAIAAPIITGYIVAATRTYALAFGISAVYLLVGIWSYIFLLGDIERVGPEAGHVHSL